MEGPLSFMCSIGETFFLSKVVDKQLGLKSLASFTNIGLDTYILLWKYCHNCLPRFLLKIYSAKVSYCQNSDIKEVCITLV